MDTPRTLPRPFLIRPSPLRGEGLRGYLLRVAERNSCGDTDLFEYFTGRVYGYVSGEAPIDYVADAVKLPRKRIVEISYRTIPPEVDGRGHFSAPCWYFGHRISKNHFRLQRPAVCPQCLEEQNATSGLWDLRAICACSWHGTWLIDQCPSCRAPLKWQRPGVSRCRCGFDLTKAARLAAPPEVLALTALIQEVVLGDLPSYVEHSHGYPKGVRQSTLEELLAMFRYCAEGILPKHPGRWSYRGRATPFFETQARAAMVMAKLLGDWPNGMFEVLAELYSASGKASSVVLRRTEFLPKLRWHLMDDWRLAILRVPEFFKAGLLQFRQEHCVRDSLRERYLRPSLVVRGKDGQRLVRVGHCQEVLGLPCKGEKPSALITFETFLARKARHLAELMSTRDAAKWLGCPSHQLNAFADLGLIWRHPSGDFLRADLAALLARIEGYAQKLGARGAATKKLVPLVKRCPKNRAQFRALFERVLEGELSLYWTGRGPVRSLKSFKLSALELNQVKPAVIRGATPARRTHAADQTGAPA